MTPALRLEALHVPFGDTPGLEDVALEMPTGERLVLVGPSGAGKTTLLRAIAGLAPSRGGRVEIGGRDVGGVPAEERGAVYLHQIPLLFPHLSVGDNVGFPLRIRGVSRRERGVRVRALLASVGLAGFEDRAPRTLSGGQKHRVALARAIAARPALLLLDEPFAALDPSLREEVRAATLAAQREFGLSLVVVTHDLDEAALLADRIGVVLERRLAQLAPPATLFARPATPEVARFLGFANQVDGTVGTDGVFRSPLGKIPSNGTPPGPARALFRAGAVRASVHPSGTARVVESRYRVDGATVVVEVGGTRIEVMVDPAAPPAPGDAAHLAVEAGRVLLYPG
jgi:putative spermidine/putrescine transport system ATP-binding protein